LTESSGENPDQSFEDLAARVMEKSGYSRERLGEEIERKRAEFDMLTEEGALTLIANELGIALDEGNEIPTMRIEDIKPGMQNLDLVGRVVRVRKPREFTRRDGSTGFVCGLVLADRTGSIMLTLWDQECRLLEEVKEQDVLKVLGGVCRSGLRGPEIHTARRARLVLNPSVSEDPRVSDLEDVVKEVETPPQRKAISDLGEGDANIEVRATVVRFYRVWVYDACPKCGRKAEGGTCEVCGGVDPKPRAILDVGIDDSSGFIRAKFFGEMAEEFLGVPASAMQSEVDSLIDRGMEARRASEEYLSREHQDLLGREVLLRGRASLDQYRGLMLTVDGIASPDPIDETLRVLEEVDS
jgi:replication factor A1